MKFNSNSIIRPATTGVIATFLLVGLSNLAFADNSAALKDAIKTDIKVAETKNIEMKEDDVSTKAPADEDFKKLDANKDSKVSLKEAVKDRTLAAQFDATDANHDGMISADEFASYKANVALKATDSAPVAPVN